MSSTTAAFRSEGVDSRRETIPFDSIIVSLAIVSLACAAIHIQAVRAHMHVWAPAAAFFAANVIAQVGWAYFVVSKPKLLRPLLLIGAVGNASIVITWTLSRTTGLPLSPMGIEPVGWGDALCSAYETALVGGCIYLLVSRREPRTLARGVNWAMAATILVATVLVLPTIE